MTLNEKTSLLRQPSTYVYPGPLYASGNLYVDTYMNQGQITNVNYTYTSLNEPLFFGDGGIKPTSIDFINIGEDPAIASVRAQKWDLAFKAIQNPALHMNSILAVDLPSISKQSMVFEKLAFQFILIKLISNSLSIPTWKAGHIANKIYLDLAISWRDDHTGSVLISTLIWPQIAKILRDYNSNFSPAVLGSVKYDPRIYAHVSTTYPDQSGSDTDAYYSVWLNYAFNNLKVESLSGYVSTMNPEKFSEIVVDRVIQPSVFKITVIGPVGIYHLKQDDFGDKYEQYASYQYPITIYIYKDDILQDTLTYNNGLGWLVISHHDFNVMHGYTKIKMSTITAVKSLITNWFINHGNPELTDAEMGVGGTSGGPNWVRINPRGSAHTTVAYLFNAFGAGANDSRENAQLGIYSSVDSVSGGLPSMLIPTQANEGWVYINYGYNDSYKQLSWHNIESQSLDFLGLWKKGNDYGEGTHPYDTDWEWTCQVIAGSAVTVQDIKPIYVFNHPLMYTQSLDFETFAHYTINADFNVSPYVTRASSTNLEEVTSTYMDDIVEQLTSNQFISILLMRDESIDLITYLQQVIVEFNFVTPFRLYHENWIQKYKEIKDMWHIRMDIIYHLGIRDTSTWDQLSSTELMYLTYVIDNIGYKVLFPILDNSKSYQQLHSFLSNFIAGSDALQNAIAIASADLGVTGAYNTTDASDDTSDVGYNPYTDFESYTIFTTRSQSRGAAALMKADYISLKETVANVYGFLASTCYVFAQFLLGLTFSIASVLASALWKLAGLIVNLSIFAFDVLFIPDVHVYYRFKAGDTPWDMPAIGITSQELDVNGLTDVFKLLPFNANIVINNAIVIRKIYDYASWDGSNTPVVDIPMLLLVSFTTGQTLSPTSRVYVRPKPNDYGVADDTVWYARLRYVSGLVGLTITDPSTWDREHKRFMPLFAGVMTTVGSNVRKYGKNWGGPIGAIISASGAAVIAAGTGMQFAGNQFNARLIPEDFYDLLFKTTYDNYKFLIIQYFINNKQIILDGLPAFNILFENVNVNDSLEPGFDFQNEDNKGIQWQSWMSYAFGALVAQFAILKIRNTYRRTQLRRANRATVVQPLEDDISKSTDKTVKETHQAEDHIVRKIDNLTNDLSSYLSKMNNRFNLDASVSVKKDLINFSKNIKKIFK